MLSPVTLQQSRPSVQAPSAESHHGRPSNPPSPGTHSWMIYFMEKTGEFRDLINKGLHIYIYYDH